MAKAPRRAAGLAAWAALTASAAWAAPGAPLPSYASLAPRGDGSSVQGWGLVAAVNGRAVDVDAPRQQWARDTTLGPRESEAGLGWRGANASAVIGYSAYDRSAPDTDAGPGPGPSGISDQLRRREGGVVGLGFAMRMR